jgi:hypothetical protein
MWQISSISHKRHVNSLLIVNIHCLLLLQIGPKNLGNIIFKFITFIFINLLFKLFLFSSYQLLTHVTN